MTTFNKSSTNYIDYKGIFLDKAMAALIDEDGYEKYNFDIYFVNDKPTQELWDLYYNEKYKYTDDKIAYLQKLS